LGGKRLWLHLERKMNTKLGFVKIGNRKGNRQ